MRRLILGKLPEVHFLTYGNKFTYCRGMGSHEPRTAAEDLADAFAALAVAQDALRETLGHVDRIIQNPTDPAGIAHQARRTARITAASLDEVGEHLRESNRTQLKSVS